MRDTLLSPRGSRSSPQTTPCSISSQATRNSPGRYGQLSRNSRALWTLATSLPLAVRLAPASHRGSSTRRSLRERPCESEDLPLSDMKQSLGRWVPIYLPPPGYRHPLAGISDCRSRPLPCQDAALIFILCLPRNGGKRCLTARPGFRRGRP